MKHQFVREANGYDLEQYPYCSFVMCIHCKDYFCDNGCDNLEEECKEAFEPLFEWTGLIGDKYELLNK